MIIQINKNLFMTEGMNVLFNIYLLYNVSLFCNLCNLNFLLCCNLPSIPYLISLFHDIIFEVKTSLGAPSIFLWVVNKADPQDLGEAKRDLREAKGDLRKAERDLGEPSFPELGRNSIFIEVMVIVLLIIHCFISLEIL